MMCFKQLFVPSTVRLLIFFFNKIFNIYFSERCIEYLTNWLEPVMQLQHLEWILLKEHVNWDDVDSSSQQLMKAGYYAKKNHQKLFITFQTLKSFANDEKILMWNKKEISVEERWIEFFNAMDGKHDCKPLGDIIEYALCLFGNINDTFIKKIWDSRLSF